MKKTYSLMYLAFVVLLLISFSSCEKKKDEVRLLVLGLDGLRPDAIEKAKTPHLHELILSGTSTMEARAVYPTSSGANWSSMILGCGPDQHGISNNDWTLEKRDIIPVVEKANGYSPSIFDILKNNYPEKRISGIFNWFTIANYFDKSIPDTLMKASTTEEAIDKIISELVEKESMFVFSQIDHMDHAGHTLGFGSEKYNQDAENLDREIGRLIRSLKENNLYESTYIITISDHGGKGYGHGNKTMEEYSVPFIINGPDIRVGKTTEEAVYNFDIAAIIADVFNCEIPNHWIGSNIHSAFGKNDMLLRDFSPQVIIYEDSIDNEFSYLKCKIWNGQHHIQYQLPENSKSWIDYQGQIKLPLGDSLVAKVSNSSKLSKKSHYYKTLLKHKGNKARVELLKQPSPKYNGKGAQSLTDGLISADNAFNNKEWLGFQGENLIANFQFEEKEKINSISFRFLENVKSWVLLPKSVHILSSVDGKNYRKIKMQNSPFSMDNENVAIHELKIDIDALETQYLKLEIENFGRLPEWHSWAGEQAWLFIDEIIID